MEDLIHSTLFRIQPFNIEVPVLGHDKGSFVVIEAIKSN